MANAAARQVRASTTTETQLTVGIDIGDTCTDLCVLEADGTVSRVLLEEFVRREGADQGEKSPMRLAGLVFLARVALRQGDNGAAVAICAESLDIHRELGPSRFPVPLNVLAQAAERCGLLAVSARLLAAGDVQRRESATETFGLQADQQAAVARVRAALGEAAFAEAWAAGETLSVDAALAFGLAVAGELQRLLATDTAAR